MDTPLSFILTTPVLNVMLWICYNESIRHFFIHEQCSVDGINGDQKDQIQSEGLVLGMVSKARYVGNVTAIQFLVQLS